MCVHLDLGSLRLSCPSTGLDLALTSNAAISTLSQSCSFVTPSVTNIESGHIWVAPATNVKVHVNVHWPNSMSGQQVNNSKQCLITALRHAALWSQLNLQPSLTVKPSQSPNTCFIVVSLTAAPSSVTAKKALTHRLGKDVPSNHLKPPENLPHWTLDEVRLGLHVSSSLPCSTPNDDSMLFEDPTLLEQQVCSGSTSTAELDLVGQAIDLIDAALRLALSDLPPKAFSGLKIEEKASFKHLEDICPAMWSSGHLEALASRAVFLPTISHAMSNSISKRAHSVALREKLKEVAQQERVGVSDDQYLEPQTIQKAISIRFWRLMQRRLCDPSAGKKLKSIRIADTVLPSSEWDEDADSILSLEKEDEGRTFYQSEDLLGPSDEEDEDLLDVEFESERGDLSTDVGLDGSPIDDDMLDYLHSEQHDGPNQTTDACLEDEMSLVFGDMLEI